MEICQQQEMWHTGLGQEQWYCGQQEMAKEVPINIGGVSKKYTNKLGHPGGCEVRNGEVI